MPPDLGEIQGEQGRNGGGKTRLLTLKDLDSRTRACKHALRLRDAIVSDLGGDANVTCAQQELAQRASVLGAMIEDQEARYLRGESVSPTEYCTLANAQRRVLADIGLERVARDITGDIREAIAKAKSKQGVAA